MGGEEERGTILGEPVLRGPGYQLIFPPMWRLASTDQPLSGRTFLQKLSFVGFMALNCCRAGEYWRPELQYQPA